MSDYLVELGARPAARSAIKALGLPIPLPQRLRRDTGPWHSQPLAGRIVAARSDGPLADVVAATLAEAGADVLVDGPVERFAAHGEAWGRRGVADTGTERLDALVFDATAIHHPKGLRAVYDFFQPRMGRIARCARVVVLTSPPPEEPRAAAAQRAVQGFVRSLGKEIGRVGATANVVVVDADATDRLPPVLRFLLSDRSAFVDLQPIHVQARVPLVASPKVRPLDGRTAVVTGGARGIGKAMCKALAREGAHVLCVDLPRDGELLAEVARDVGGTAVLCDVTQDDASTVIGDAIRAHAPKGADVIVHNAGVTRDKTLKNMDEARWDLTLAVNLAAVADLVEGLPLAVGGRVVLLSSIAGLAGNVGQTNYAASKAGIVGLVEAWAPRLADRAATINAIAPGFIETRLTAAIPAATREVARRLSALSQGGLPADIAEVTTFLASPGAAGITGQVIRVCGGSLVGA